MWLPLTVIKCNLVWFNMLQYNFLSRFFSEYSGNFTHTRLCSLGTYFYKLVEGVYCMEGERLLLFLFQKYQTNVTNKFKYAAPLMSGLPRSLIKPHFSFVFLMAWQLHLPRLSNTLLVGECEKDPKPDGIKVDLSELFLWSEHIRTTDNI